MLEVEYHCTILKTTPEIQKDPFHPERIESDTLTHQIENFRKEWSSLQITIQNSKYNFSTISDAIRQKKEDKLELKRMVWIEKNVSKEQQLQKVTKHWSPSDELPDGIYSKLDTPTDPSTLHIYQVKKALHGSGRKVARILTIVESGPVDAPIRKGKWKYLGLASKYVTLADRMSKEDAMEWGKLYSICARCGIPLTDPTSIELGIGPICRGDKNWA